MKIKTNEKKQNKPTFRDVKCGDIFADINNELYVKLHRYDGYNCVSIRAGQLCYCPEDNNVKLVKSITVKMEDENENKN